MQDAHEHLPQHNPNSCTRTQRTPRQHLCSFLPLHIHTTTRNYKHAMYALLQKHRTPIYASIKFKNTTRSPLSVHAANTCDNNNTLNTATNYDIQKKTPKTRSQTTPKQRCWNSATNTNSSPLLPPLDSQIKYTESARSPKHQATKHNSTQQTETQDFSEQQA